MSLKKDFGKRLKEIRTKRGLTQFKLAEIVEIDAKHMSHIETGRSFPKADLIEKFAIALKVEYSTFFDTQTSKNRDEIIHDINNLLTHIEENDLIKIHYLLLKAFI